MSFANLSNSSIFLIPTAIFAYLAGISGAMMFRVKNNLANH